MSGLDRRELLGLLAALTASPAFLQACGGGPDPAALRSTVAGAHPRWPRYRALGRRILDDGVVESRPRALARALARTLGWRAGQPAATAQKDLLAAVREDFAQGRLVSVAGWMLSRTEARVLALLAAEAEP